MRINYDTVWKLIQNGEKVVLTLKNNNFKEIIDEDIRKKKFLQVEFVKSEGYIKYIDWSGELWDLDNELFKIYNVLDGLRQRGPIVSMN
jgi:hypothetical protein